MKPVCVFTNFWDANILVQDQYMTYCFHESQTEKKFYMVWLRNYQVYSIALGMPSESKIPFLKSIFRLNLFCPTYDLLMDYKENNDWNNYRERYRGLLVSRKDDIDNWVNSLENDKIYILCCWEDTSKKCNCHRKLLFDAFRSTKIWKDKAIWIYRHGNGKSLRMPTTKTNSNLFSSQESFSDGIGGEILPVGTDIVFMDTVAFSSYTASKPNSNNYDNKEIE